YLLETTLQHLSPAAQRVLELVSVFRHPINLYDEGLIDLLQPIDCAGDLAAGVGEVQRRYLIERPARAALHRLVRDHVYAMLSANVRRRRELHHVAARWSEQVAEGTVEAAYHYARADEPEPAADVLDNQADRVIERGQALSGAEVVDELLAQ